MGYLVAVTLIWAFSFSLIGVYLAGQVDAYCAVLIRLTLAALIFAPWLRPRATGRFAALGLMGIGALQIGLMYLCLYQAYLFLSVPEVLLFTILTPVYITLAEDVLARRFSPRYLVAALLAVAGAAVIRYTEISPHYWRGFFLLQGANLFFALGQVAYRRLSPRLSVTVPLHAQFGWFFIGAWPLAALAFAVLGDWRMTPDTGVQWTVLIWLGAVASGAGYYLWNRGAARVDAGTLAVMNNALIPAGLIVNLVIWNHEVDLARLGLGGLIIGAALATNRYWARSRRPASVL